MNTFVTVTSWVRACRIAPLLLALAPSARAAPVDITAQFSNDATEATTGVFIPVQRGAVNAGSFPYLKYTMRPVTLSGGTTGSSVTLEATPGPTISIYTTLGVPVALPATFPVTSLPLTLLVHGGSDGGAKLKLSDTATSDLIVFRVGASPGHAGRKLSDEPYFEYVRAFRHDAPIYVAIDPTRYPDRIDKKFDVYIVKHRTPAQWGLDNSLTDLTADGVERFALSAGATQDNHWDVWTLNINGDGGRELGVGYDVVLDYGLNGKLDPGDLIDSLSADEPGLYVVDDVNALGPYATASFEFDDPCLFQIPTFQTIPPYCARSRGLVVYPSPLPQRSLPLVVFAHGATPEDLSYRGYGYLQQLLASHGFVTVGIDTLPAQDVAYSIPEADAMHRAWLILKSTERMVLQSGPPRNYPVMGGGVLEPGGNSVISGKQIVVSGHSRGGEAAVLASSQLRHLFDPAQPFPPAIVPPGETVYGFERVLGIHDIAGTTFNLATNGNTPLDTPYLLTWGTLDRDVTGQYPEVQPTRRFSRATGKRAVDFVYTAQHGCFNQYWGYDCFAAPWYASMDETQRWTKGTVHPWVQWVVRGTRPAVDFSTRNTEVFRAIGADGILWRLSTRFSHGDSDGGFVIDHFETNPLPGLSSSGGLVTYTVTVDEEDAEWWEGRHVRLGWSGSSQRYTQQIVAGRRDWRSYRYVSLAISHDVTTNIPDVDDNFQISLIDESGNRSTLSSKEYGPVHLNDQYFDGDNRSKPQTFRFRLTDFDANGRALDLSRIASVELQFGTAHGSASTGQFVIDDLELISHSSLD
jgi:hypothetical protein